MSRFKDLTEFSSHGTEPYSLLPFKFSKLDDADNYVVTNLVGEFQVLPRPALVSFIEKRLARDSEHYHQLRSRHFLTDADTNVAIDLLELKARTRYGRLADFTALHMVVVTLRCDHSCPYCQVSRQTEDRHAYDMSEDTADKALDFIFRSPSPSLKIEFQGGETLLNFDGIKYIVHKAEERNKSEKRNLGFVIATNLALVTDEKLDLRHSTAQMRILHTWER